MGEDISKYDLDHAARACTAPTSASLDSVEQRHLLLQLVRLYLEAPIAVRRKTTITLETPIRLPHWPQARTSLDHIAIREIYRELTTEGRGSVQ